MTGFEQALYDFLAPRVQQQARQLEELRSQRDLDRKAQLDRAMQDREFGFRGWQGLLDRMADMQRQNSQETTSLRTSLLNQTPDFLKAAGTMSPEGLNALGDSLKPLYEKAGLPMQLPRATVGQETRVTPRGGFEAGPKTPLPMGQQHFGVGAGLGKSLMGGLDSNLPTPGKFTPSIAPGYQADTVETLSNPLAAKYDPKLLGSMRGVYSAVYAQTGDSEAAMNAALSFASQGTGGAAPGITPPTSTTPSGPSPLFLEKLKSLRAGSDLKLAQAKTEGYRPALIDSQTKGAEAGAALKTAQAGKAAADTRLAEVNTKLKEALLPYAGKQAKADLDRALAQTDLSRANAMLARVVAGLKPKMTDAEIANIQSMIGNRAGMLAVSQMNAATGQGTLAIREREVGIKEGTAAGKLVTSDLATAREREKQLRSAKDRLKLLLAASTDEKQKASLQAELAGTEKEMASVKDAIDKWRGMMRPDPKALPKPAPTPPAPPFGLVQRSASSGPLPTVQPGRPTTAKPAAKGSGGRVVTRAAFNAGVKALVETKGYTAQQARAYFESKGVKVR